MLRRLLGLGRNPNRAVADSLYEKIVAAARQPAFYSEWNVPDTPLGRFEMIAVHVFLFLHRVRGESGAVADLAQELTDGFFADVDRSLRELGIGDMGIPKRVKKMARMFYGRAAAYGTAVDAADASALAGALARNIRPDVASWAEADALAAYVLEAHAALAGQADTAFLAGSIAFPEARE